MQVLSRRPRGATSVQKQTVDKDLEGINNKRIGTNSKKRLPAPPARAAGGSGIDVVAVAVFAVAVLALFAASTILFYTIALSSDSSRNFQNSSVVVGTTLNSSSPPLPLPPPVRITRRTTVGSGNIIRGITGSNSGNTNMTEIFYRIDVAAEGANFSDECRDRIDTFEFKSSKVKWIKAGGNSHPTRSMSTHCMLARAAERLGPDFEASVRIGTANVS